jgi:hypothetical protein
VTLALEAVVVAGGIFLGRLVARVMKQRKASRSAEASRTHPAEATREGAEASRANQADASRTRPGVARRATSRSAGRSDGDEGTDTLEGFACQLGDVVVRRVEGDEAWLAGALVLAEERPVAALFIAPVAGGERALLVPGPARSALTWLTPLADGEVALAGEPPRTIEQAGVRFERTRRLPVRVHRLGKGAPRVGPTAVFGEYEAHGSERLVVVVGSEAAFAWRGVALAEGEYDVLPGSPATLERIP